MPTQAMKRWSPSMVALSCKLWSRARRLSWFARYGSVSFSLFCGRDAAVNAVGVIICSIRVSKVCLASKHSFMLVRSALPPRKSGTTSWTFSECVGGAGKWFGRRDRARRGWVGGALGDGFPYFRPTIKRKVPYFQKQTKRKYGTFRIFKNENTERSAFW